MKLKVNQKKQVKNWDDTCLNIYHRVNKNSVIVEHIYRYAPTIKKTMSYKKWKEFKENTKPIFDFLGKIINGIGDFLGDVKISKLEKTVRGGLDKLTFLEKEKDYLT